MAQKEEKKALPMEKYGTHECTCDGCDCQPIVGFRYKCTKCPDHDICEVCFDTFNKKGILLHVNKMNNVSRIAKDHAFEPFVDSKAFEAMNKKAGVTVKKASKVKPNDKCTCGSGKKFKKCCGAMVPAGTASGIGPSTGAQADE